MSQGARFGCAAVRKRERMTVCVRAMIAGVSGVEAWGRSFKEVTSANGGAPKPRSL